MICWGEKHCCGVFISSNKKDKCDCLRDSCIKDVPPEERVLVSRAELNDTRDHVFLDDDDYLAELNSMLQIKSIANTKEFELQNKQIIDRLAERLLELEFNVEVVEVQSKDKDTAPYHVIFADCFSTPMRNVMLIYGHVDVPAVQEKDLQNWLHPPFALTENDERLYGRGVTSSKGPILCWIQVIEAWLAETRDLPVNIKFVISNNHQADTKSLRDVFEARKNFFSSVNLIIGINNLWIAEKIPMIATCHSGYIRFELEVRAKDEAHKAEDAMCGCGCGISIDPMAQLCLLLNTLTDTQHGILVEGLMRHVVPVTQHDWDIFGQAEVGIQEYKQMTGATSLPHEQSQQEFLKHRWCMPGLTLHSVENTSSGNSLRDFHKPARVRATFTVKLVSEQSLKYVSFKVKDHLDMAFLRMKCKHPAYLRVLDQLPPTNVFRKSRIVSAASRAFKGAFNVKTAIPDTINVCMPIMNELRTFCMKDAQVLGLPFCSMHMKPNQVNESLSRDEYQSNLQMFVLFLYEVAHVPCDCKCNEIPKFCYQKGKATEPDFVRIIGHREEQTHVLYELDERSIRRTASERTAVDALPDAKHVLLGTANDYQRRHHSSQL